MCWYYKIIIKNTILHLYKQKRWFENIMEEKVLR